MSRFSMLLTSLFKIEMVNNNAKTQESKLDNNFNQEINDFNFS